MATPAYVSAALLALAADHPRYEEAEEYYLGQTAEFFASRRLQRLIGDAGSAYRINFARTPVDSLLEKTQIQGITGAGDTTYLDDAWDANELGLEAKDIHRRAYEFGDAYLIGWPDDTLPGGVSLYCHDPRDVKVFYNPSRPREKSHAVHVWSDTVEDRDGLFLRVNLYWPEYVEQFISTARIDNDRVAGIDGGPLIAAGQGGVIDLVPYVSDDAPEGVIVNPVPGTIPVFHFRTQRPYGRPEHADAYGPQNALNKLIINMMATVDYAGFPQRYVTTDSAMEPGPVDDGLGPIDPNLTELDLAQRMSNDSQMEAGPGTTWLLSGSKVGVGQFAVAETTNFLNAIESVIKQMSVVTDTPGHYFDRSGQMPSGESFRRAEAPQNAKLADREAQFGVTWHEVFQYIADVNGKGDTDAQVSWAPPTVQLDLESWQTAQAQIATGIPKDQTWRERGYSEELVDEWLAAEAAAPPPPPPVPPGQAPQTPSPDGGGAVASANGQEIPA
jgi:hypothetical protein